MRATDAVERDGGDAYRGLSYWLDSLPSPLVPRPALGRDLDVDVVIVGGGFTGLWTAYYLAVADPDLRVVVLEAEVAGFGASGRNGGWCSALFATHDATLARAAGPEAPRAMRRALQETVDEVGRVALAEGIDCHFAKGGTVVVARNEAQRQRATEEVGAARRYGAGERDITLLSADEALSLVRTSDVLGGTYTPHCAAVHPGRLVRGLAEAVERRGVTVYESSPACALGSGVARTLHAKVRAEVIVRATEGYTVTLPGLHRALVPVYSHMVATEPLPDRLWAEIGLSRRETFSDGRHLVIYGQRTADGRIAFGGRAAPYYYGSRVRPSQDRPPRARAMLRRVLVELFPSLRDAAITHAWGGPLGVPRDWFSSVGFDRHDGVAWAGGYVGDGVATANLAGRTLADLITGRHSDLTALAWVGHRWRPWEPEPLRWLGIKAASAAVARIDRAEKRGRRAHVASAAARILQG